LRAGRSLPRLSLRRLCLRRRLGLGRMRLRSLGLRRLGLGLSGVLLGGLGLAGLALLLLRCAGRLLLLAGHHLGAALAFLGGSRLPGRALLGEALLLRGGLPLGLGRTARLLPGPLGGELLLHRSLARLLLRARLSAPLLLRDG
jgi:hypothetical protein